MNRHLNNFDTSAMGQDNEISLMGFFRKIWKNRWFLIGSVATFVILAMAYVLMATPKYEVSTSLLIDPDGSSRMLGESQYVQGGVGLIETEKNLYNEIGILRSFSLTRETVKDLGFGISYRAGNWMKSREYYKYFPFEVTLDTTHSQLYNVPIEIELIGTNQFRVRIEAKDFEVYNPVTESTTSLQRKYNFSGTFRFGEAVIDDYFKFVLTPPDYTANADDFAGKSLEFTVHNPDKLARTYLDKTEVNNIDIQASIFKISTQGALVEKEKAFLNQLTANYVQAKLDARNRIASTKEDFVRNQLDIIADSLLTTELELEAFKSSAMAVNLGATAMGALDRTQNLEIDRSKIQMNIQYYRSLIKYVENNRNNDEFVVPSAIGIEDPLINENVVELQRLYAERAQKKFYVTDKYSEMQILNKRIDEALSTLLSNLRNAIRAEQLKMSGLQNELASYNGVISDLPTQEKELLSLQRKSALYEGLFNYLSQELAKTEIAGAENISDTRVLDAALLEGSGPVSPQKLLLLTLAVALGILLTLAKIVFFPQPETINEIGQILQLSEIPVIASIARHLSEGSKKSQNASLWKVKESFRDLYANLKLVGPKKTCKVIGFTSIMPEEGKTFCAINSGITLAEAGHKTLIIDLDLRSPSLITQQSKLNGKGLSDYLEGGLNDYNEIIYPYNELENLEFIPTAVAAENIQALLNSSKLKALLLHLKDRYEYIILDTPAVGLVSDFLLFVENIDVNLFVVRRKHSQEKYLNQFQYLINQGDFSGKNYIIFNDADGKGHKYGYGQKYGRNTERFLINEALSV